MPADEGFGPSGAGAAEAAPFVVGGPAQLSLDASRIGAASFTVSNVSGRPVRARVQVQPGPGADASWFSIARPPGEPSTTVESATAERALPVAGTATVDVTVRVPEQAPAGSTSFVLTAALEEAPDRVVAGPTAAFQVPPLPAKQKKFPWWIVIVAAAVLLVGGGILIWILTRPDNPPAGAAHSEAPSASATVPMLAHGTVTFNVGNALVDFEGSEPTISLFGYCKFIPGSDLCFYDQDIADGEVPAFEPLSVSSTVFAGVAIVADGDRDTCVEAMSDPETPSGVSVPDLPIPTFVCFITGQRHYAVLEISPQKEGDPLRTVSYTVWEGNA
jgi:hypothetical protein